MKSYLFPTYQRKSFEIVEGTGSWAKDNLGNAYLDFTSGIGVTNLGYQHPLIESVLIEQAQKIWHTTNLYENHLQEAVAQRLANGQDFLSYFCSSGAEANEAAIKLARKYTGKSEIISFENSFHGRTYGAMSATPQANIQAGFSPLVPDFVYLPFNEITPLKRQINQNTAAVIVELIQGEGGIVPADIEWVQQVAQLCHDKDVLLIIDEVQTGIGRTGTLFAYEQYQIEPDIFTSAKALGNGFPVGAMVGKEKLKSAFGVGSHGTTFGGNPLAMAVANEVLTIMQTTDLLSEVQEKSNYFFERLTTINPKYIKEIRGKGLMVGIELKESLAVADVINELTDVGLLTLNAGTNTLRLLPPLTLTKAEIDIGIDKLKAVLENPTF
ncbi:MAG: acetylornithine transaminase [Tetragenococcus koreensis]|nr:acetylornithine transaminase [Tetragenococcus koreensis]